MTDFLMAEIEEKEKKRVEMESENSPLILSWRRLPKRTSNMPYFVLQTGRYPITHLSV